MLLGQSIPSARAVRRNARTSCSGAGGSVRSTPTFPSIISFAAAKPVSSDSWAFQFSTGSIARYSSRSRSPSSVDLLGRHRQRDPAALGLLRDPQLADDLQQGQRRPVRRLAELALHADVVELAAASAPGPAPPSRR